MSRRNLISGTRKLTSFIFSNTNNNFLKSSSSTKSTIITNPLLNDHNRIFHHHQFQSPLNSISTLNHLHNYTPKPSPMAAASLTPRLYSSSPPPSSSSSSPDPDPNPDPNPEMKHQEIEGPTVDPDLSPLANETREVTTSLLKTMYNLSKVLALLGLAQLALNAYSYYTVSSSSSLSSPLTVQLCLISAISFGFPFSTAFMLRQSLKSMQFFQKMEQIGRLQILTCSMQIFKHLRLFFFRLRSLSYLCLAGLSFSFLYSVSSSL